METKTYKVNLSGTSVLGRSWDAGISKDSNDPLWNSIVESFSKRKSIKQGRGYKVEFELNKRQVECLIKDLEDNIDIYYDNYADDWRVAWKRDVERMKKLIL